ncbi:accessory factor UbiK family protein [Snodgrassella sp. B3882]|uniref:accessory factor UbiK family protein n=1 Tax=Snodgrassella sp. B3882 TaxID=2818037 RepID=UPI002269A02A|nr:accessory factor UbiK family protein [Snodgrassella sp. B3882]MCX8744573.1 accessory factor UbiK family protein [Snodgrassella sp. B3882]
MLNKKLFDDISSKISDTIANSPIKDVEQNIKAILTSTLSRLNLVTREEFEIQQQVLLKTREKLAELEAQVTALAGKLSEQPAQIKDHTSESADTDQNQPAL